MAMNRAEKRKCTDQGIGDGLSFQKFQNVDNYKMYETLIHSVSMKHIKEEGGLIGFNYRKIIKPNPFS